MSALTRTLCEGEYDAQFFDTAPYCLSHEMKELTLNDVERVTSKLQKQLISKCPTSDHSECEKLIRILRAKYEKSVDHFFNELEPSFNDIFRIPLHVLLPEDAIQKVQYDEKDVQQIDDEIQTLLSRYRRGVCMESSLKKELKSSSCVDIIEKKTLEVEDNIRALANIFEHNSPGLQFLSDELTELMSVANQVQPLSLIENTNGEYLNEKLNLRNQ